MHPASFTTKLAIGFPIMTATVALIPKITSLSSGSFLFLAVIVFLLGKTHEYMLILYSDYFRDLFRRGSIYDFVAGLQISPDLYAIGDDRTGSLRDVCLFFADYHQNYIFQDGSGPCSRLYSVLLSFRFGLYPRSAWLYRYSTIPICKVPFGD